MTKFPPVKTLKTDDPRPREPCPFTPPPPKPPPDDTWFWAAMTVLFLSGVGIVAAKATPEIRDWLTLYAPWLDDFIAILYQENLSYAEYAEKCIDDLKKYIEDYSDDKKPKQCSLDGKPVEEPPVCPKQEKPEDEEEDEEEETPEKCECPKPPILTQGICEVERCLKELGETAVNNYDTAKEACAYYNGVVQETMKNFTAEGLKKLHEVKQERLDLVKEHIKNAEDAVKRFEELNRYLDCGVQAPKDAIAKTKLLHKDLRQLYTGSRMQFQWQNDKSLVMDTQWEMVEMIIDKYTSENECLYPGLKYLSKKPHIGGDPDILLYHTYRYINQLNQELKDATEGMSERVNRAYDMLPQCKEKKKAREYALQSALSKKRAEMDKEFKQRYDKQRADNDKLLKELILKQKQRHEELMKTRLEQKEKETKVKLAKLVADRVAAEKRVFAAQLADMAVKLAAVEDKLNARLKAERDTRRSQELWTAGASLLAATKKGGRNININRELNAIEKASDGTDKLVLTVLKSIPPAVRENGLMPESVLKDRYKLMESTALRVALVEEDGGPMPVYILSWLQAALLFMKISGIPQAEYDKIPEEPSPDLDTFDLLQRARFWVERGNLAAALRYVNSLKGASRLAAHQWYEAARTHLEVRQAAEAVLAHAAAMGLQYI
ncbi:MICOS complex subunit Mic60-like [Anticarsia gemmatalis]|uniref:MICOS complex subunit Mic60-like n=1 Tax=Anticarsia gemmatalis TaxID=129554 RepID=UPI003F7644FA